MAYFFFHFSLNLISSDIKKKKNIQKPSKPTYRAVKVSSQQFPQQHFAGGCLLCPLLMGTWKVQRGISRHLLHYRGENLDIYSFLKMQKVTPMHEDSATACCIFTQDRNTL